jgi:PAS domain S-box-containing protein
MESRSYPHCGDRLTCTPVQRWKEDTTSHTGERLRRPALFGYVLAFVSVGAALLLTIILLHFDSPLPFTAFALSAIAVTFWYGRTKPGILAVFLSTLTRSYFFKPATTAVSRMLYDSSFLVFMLLIIGLMWERDELEVKVAERTEELTGANEKLRIEIVERKQAEEVVKQAEDRLRRVIDTIPTIVWRKSPDGSADFLNQRFREYTGFSLEDGLGWGWMNAFHPDDRLMEEWRADFAAGKPFEKEARLLGADGEYRWFLIRAVPLRDEPGNLVGWYGSSVDIEERKSAERQSRALIDAIPMQIWSGPPDGTVDYCNERWRSYMGLGLEELQGDGWQSMLHPDDRNRVLKAWHESVANRTPYEQEERHRGADGTYRWFLSRGLPLRDAEGRVLRWYGTNTDIEDRRQAEEELRRLSGQLLRSQDEERRRIARDLHDSTGQDLVALATMLGELRASTPSSSPKSPELVSECQALAEHCIREVRTLSYLLYPPMLDEAGLEDAIRHYLDGFTKRAGIRVDLEVSPGYRRMTSDIELALFRVVQESLTNVQRHSGSLQAKIRLVRNADEVTLEISDSGRETSDRELKRDKSIPFEVGVGIPSMRERVKLIGGRLTIASGSHGTTVRVTLPAEGEKHEAASNSDS